MPRLWSVPDGIGIPCRFTVCWHGHSAVQHARHSLTCLVAGVAAPTQELGRTFKTLGVGWAWETLRRCGSPSDRPRPLLLLCAVLCCAVLCCAACCKPYSVISAAPTDHRCDCPCAPQHGARHQDNVWRCVGCRQPAGGVPVCAVVVKDSLLHYVQCVDSSAERQAG